MDASNAPHGIVTTPPERAAFLGMRWNGWTLSALALVCILGFFVTQTVILAFILLRDYPDAMRYPAVLQHQMADPQFVINLLTAKNLWVISVVSETVLALMTLGFAQMAFRVTPAQLGLRRPTRRWWVLWGVGTGVALLIISSIIEWALRVFFGPHPVQPQALALAKHHGVLPFLLDIMSVSIAAPIAEETFFRGFVFAGLAQRMSPIIAMAISAGLFGIAHLEKWSFLPIFAIGFGLAWLYYRTRSLWVNIVAHSTVNTISLVIAYVCPHCVTR